MRTQLGTQQFNACNVNNQRTFDSSHDEKQEKSNSLEKTFQQSTWSPDLIFQGTTYATAAADVIQQWMVYNYIISDWTHLMVKIQSWADFVYNGLHYIKIMKFTK